MSNPKVKTIIAPDSPAGTQILVIGIADHGIPADARTIYHGRNIIAATSLLDGTEVNVKSFHIPHLINRCVYGWMRGSKAHRSFHNALRLRKLHISTPAPYAYIEERTSGGFLRRSYYISRQLSDDYSTVRFINRRPDFEEAVEALAAFIARLHRKGVWMKDLSPGNVMIRRREADDGSATYDFSLVDINRMEFGVSDLDTLITSCGTLLDSEEALVLFAGMYAGLLGVDAGHAEDLILSRFRKVNRMTITRRIKRLLRGNKER